MHTIEKYANESFVVGIDFTDEFEATETITPASGTVVGVFYGDDAIITPGSVAIAADNKTLTVRIEGGVAPKGYKLKFTVGTNKGNTFSDLLLVRIID